MVSNANKSYTKFCNYCEREVSRSRFFCERSGFRSWTFLLERFSKRVPKDKSCDDISMKTLIGVATHTLNLVMSYHLQKVLLRRAKRNVGKR